ncbi:AAA family ATPase [Hugenholtzia roseola]|uniref:AAA family ATPase n=1 Tax=Hugenholtzia roseola TaxID=1002 RepID=UPI0003F93B47|nr:AAA family ATPase [Hugenholtzia roseola]
MKIEKLKVKNFKVFHNMEIRDFPNLCVFLGANGSGKTTLFDVFGFLSSALHHNVKHALHQRGGFDEVISRNSTGDIEFELKFRDTPGSPLVTYELSIGLSENKSPIVTKEVLSYRRGSRGRPYRFLDFSRGRGSAIINEAEFAEAKQEFKDQREEQVLESPDILAIKGLGQFKKFKAISTFRRLLENWFVSNFQIQAAQNIEETGLSEHLSRNGNNLAQVTEYIYENHRPIFEQILGKMKKRIPGISEVRATKTIDGRIVLQFKDGTFKDPFISRYVSDGTIKMFAYLILLNDPTPHPLLCVEEPENYLHPELLRELAEEFREYAQQGQVFISTHSPDFVNHLKIEELFWLYKKDGYTQVQRAKDDKVVQNLVKEGDALGYLWTQGYLKGSGIKSLI